MNDTRWNVVASPNAPGLTSDELFGVAAIAANDIWAVGDFAIEQLGSPTSQALIEHWDGTEWSIAASPSIASEGMVLGAISATDIWAVGAGATGPLIIHWNGTAWSEVASHAGSSDRLSGVTAVSATDAWAVGTASGPTPSTPDNPLIEHWNGSQWSIVTLPLPGVGADLNSIVVVSASNIWAVGNDESEPGEPGPTFPLIEH